MIEVAIMVNDLLCYLVFMPGQFCWSRSTVRGPHDRVVSAMEDTFAGEYAMHHCKSLCQ